MQFTQQIHLQAASSCSKLPLSSVSLLELKSFTAWGPQQFFGNFPSASSRTRQICYRFVTTFFPKHPFSSTSIFQGKAILVVNCWSALNTTSRRGHSVSLAALLHSYNYGPLSHKHSFMWTEFMRQQVHPNGYNASGMEQDSRIWMAELGIGYLLRAWHV